MNKFFSQALYLVLEIFDWLNEELISIVEDYYHLLVLYLVQTTSIARISEFRYLVELISKHILVPDIVKINEEIYLVDSTLN